MTSPLTGAPRPPKDPNLGHGGKDYFIWSAANDTDEEFTRLYGARVSTMARRFGDDPDCTAAMARLLAPGKSAIPGTIEFGRQRIEAYVRERVTEFIDQPPTGEPKTKADAITALTDLICNTALSPAFQAFLA